MTFPPRCGSHHDYSRQHAADYTHRFDTVPSPRSGSGTPHYGSAGIFDGIHADVWYNKVAKEFDEMSSSRWNEDLGLTLSFVSLIPGGSL